MKEHARAVARDEQKAVFLGRASSGMWEHVMWMTGYEKYYMDMVINPKLCQAKMEKILELKMQYWGRVLELVEEDYVVVSCADDLGGQNGLLVSLDMYQELVWPYHRRLFQFLKSTPSKAKVYVFFHNDGAIYETLPLLIEAGVDIINPWQVNCAGMDDTAKFKREFGKRPHGLGRQLRHAAGAALRDAAGGARRDAVAASTTWRPAAATSSRPSTSSRTACPSRTSWPCGRHSQEDGVY